MSVLAERPPPGEALSDFVQKGTAQRKWVKRRKGISKARALTVSHISPWNILPRGVAGTSSPFRGFKRGRRVVRTCPRRTGAILGGGLDKFANCFSSQVSIVLESIFIWHLQTQKKKISSKNTYTHIRLLGTWYNLWASQGTLPQNIFPIQRHLFIPCGQIVILNLVT